MGRSTVTVILRLATPNLRRSERLAAQSAVKDLNRQLLEVAGIGD